MFFMLTIILVYMNKINALECSIRSVLNPLKLYNLLYFISTDCSIREYLSDFSPLCCRNIPAYYALNYAGILDGGLVITVLAIQVFKNHSCIIIQMCSVIVELHYHTILIAAPNNNKEFKTSFM